MTISGGSRRDEQTAWQSAAAVALEREFGGQNVIGWANLNPLERESLIALAAMHKELGPGSLFTSDAVGVVVGRPVVAELGFLAQYGLIELTPDDNGVRGYRLTGEGYQALPASMERLALAEHREEADQALREEQ
jgi:hypothetical protein